MTSRALVVALGLAAGRAPAAQAQAHTIRGIVFDSIAGRPLSGAVIQAVAVDDGRGTAFSAITDSTGHYVLSGVPAGKFAVGFQHEALSALGLESPIRAVELASDTTVALDLGIPSGPVVRARACGTTDKTGDGLLAGYVLDASTGAVPKATVMVQWIEVNLSGRRLKSDSHRVLATVGEDGTYRACGIPADGPVTVRVSAQGRHTIEMELTSPAGGVTRRDFRLVNATERRGAATIALRVVNDSGAPVPSGLAMIPELDRQATVEHGDAVITDIPAGSWLVTLRSLGFLPREVVLDASPERMQTTIALVRPEPVLDTVRVVASQVRKDSQTVNAIRQRLLTSHGTLIAADNPYVRNSSEATNALRAATGFIVNAPTKVEARAFGTGATCVSKPTATSFEVTGKFLAVYLNGERVPGGLEAINQMVMVRDILAIEAYPDVSSAPFLWRTRDACAVVAFWTKH